MWLINKIKSLFEKKMLVIKLPTSYGEESNISIHGEKLPNWVLKDIKEQATREILNDSKLKKRLDKEKIISVEFGRHTVTTRRFDVPHLFYWNGEELFSVLLESQSMGRDIKLDNLLNGKN